MKEQAKRRLYGQLLVDFANSKTTDEAGLGYLANLQKVYDFSHEFIKKAHEGFPKMLDPSDPEKNIKVIELMSRANELHSKINDFLQGKAHLLYYDDLLGGALVLDTEIVVDASDSVDIEFRNHPTPYYIKDLMKKDDFFYNISEPHLEQLIDVEDGEEYEDYIYPDFTEIKANILDWVQIVKALTDYKEKNPPYTYSDHSLDKSRFQVALGEHYHIQTCIDTLRDLLQAIVDKDLNTAMNIAQRFINIYNNSVSQPRANITNQLTVSIENKFREDLFLNRDLLYYPMYILPSYYDLPLADCIVEFFKTPGNFGSIRKCLECNNNFFIPVRKTKIYCSDDCRMDYNNRQNVKSGYNKEFKKKKKKEGKAPASYYGPLK